MDSRRAIYIRSKHVDNCLAIFATTMIERRWGHIRRALFTHRWLDFNDTELTITTCILCSAGRRRLSEGSGISLGSGNSTDETAGLQVLGAGARRLLRVRFSVWYDGSSTEGVGVARARGTVADLIRSAVGGENSGYQRVGVPSGELFRRVKWCLECGGEIRVQPSFMTMN